ncbi:MAG: HAD hydrolase family protein [Chlamydiae bacterium]|nr:HAD hydrolase family protein [Chlamydiota bacterium]MBI3267062.1 HAD hydrolase family protein [Chlamydiota bacterium]
MKKQTLSVLLRNIKALALDVDGVLTDGVIYLDGDGKEFKTFHALDGLGIVLAKRAGLKTVFISARESKALLLRAKELGVDALYQNRLEKGEAFEDLLRNFRLQPEEVCYVGDDLIDISILKRVGFSVAVQNAVSEVKRVASYVTQSCGGRGAVREVVEKILKAQGVWEEVIAQYV